MNNDEKKLEELENTDDELKSLDELDNNELSNEELEELSDIEDIESCEKENVEFFEDEELEEKKNFKKGGIKFLIMNISLLVLSILYFIFKKFDPFKNITTSDISNHALVGIFKYVIIISLVIVFISIILIILHFTKAYIMKSRILDNINGFLEWYIILPICIVVTTFLFCFVFTFSEVSGTSMEPNFQNGEQVLLRYNEEIERFDCVVFRVNNKYKGIFEESLYIKRVIGMPGEHVEYVASTDYDGNPITLLYVDGVLVDEYFYEDDELYKYNTTGFDFEHICSNQEATYKDGVQVIPEGYYLVLGDNRGVSKDSRVIGLISEKDIIGVVTHHVNSLFSYDKV